MFPRGANINVAYIVEALRRFLKALRKKRPHWDNAPVHTVQLVQTFLAKNSTQVISHPHPHSPDLAPAGFSLLALLKKDLSGLTMTLTEF